VELGQRKVKHEAMKFQETTLVSSLDQGEVGFRDKQHPQHLGPEGHGTWPRPGENTAIARPWIADSFLPSLTKRWRR